MMDHTQQAESPKEWWRRRAALFWLSGLGMAGLGGFRGGLAGSRWYALLTGSAWVNPKTHWELGLTTGWNMVLLLAGVNLLMRAVRGRAAPERTGGVFVLSCALVLAGECAVTVALWAAYR